MSSPTPNKTTTEGISGPVPQEYYAPPPGPPPNQSSAHHSNEQPIPDYEIPAYNPSSPSFAPPPSATYGQAAGAANGHYDSPASPTGTKSAFSNRLSALGAKASSPINMLANKMGAEGFLPASMDKECEKAARILRGFCKDGIYADTKMTQPATTAREGKGKQQQQPSRAIITIPAKVLQRAVGLAVFTTGRVGFHVSGATGSGVLIARQPDGGWSPPSGIQIHSVGAGFVFGADIYDCVLVINTEEALHAFLNTRLSLGTDLAVVAGPWGAGGSLEVAAPTGDRQRPDRPGSVGSGGSGAGAGLQPTNSPDSSGGSPSKKPSKLRRAASHAVYSYIKSRGIYAGVQVDGTVITERSQANAAFYGARISATRILRGEVPPGGWVKSAGVLMDAIRGAEGRAAAAFPAQAHAQAASGQGQAQPQAQPQSPTQAYPKWPTQAQGPETWANAAPATVFMPRTGPIAPEHVSGAENSTADDLPPAYEEPGHAYPGVGDNKTTH